jgi:hypothetical protein
LLLQCPQKTPRKVNKSIDNVYIIHYISALITYANANAFAIATANVNAIATANVNATANAFAFATAIANAIANANAPSRG